MIHAAAVVAEVEQVGAIFGQHARRARANEARRASEAGYDESKRDV